jgi:DNA-binding LacI/PurR family transcriptional regulator
MPSTIKDIARQAGVSHTTVSRALHRSPLISEATTLRIQKIAVELGYRPSVAARSLKTNRSQALGVIVAHIADPFFSEILEGIDDVAQENGYSLFIASAQDDPVRENSIIQTMREHRVDGVILCSPNLTPQQSKQINSYNIPIVAINNQASQGYRFAIYHDDTDGGRQICLHLISLGHKKIAFLGNIAAGRTNLERLVGFKQAMEEANLSVPVDFIHHASGNSPEHGLEGVEYYLHLPEMPTAVICYNDLMAIGVLKELHRAGLRVPEDISVTGFDNIIYSGFTRPPLTTFDQPKRFLGSEAAHMMFEQLNARTIPPSGAPIVTRLKGNLLIRQSTKVPKPK